MHKHSAVCVGVLPEWYHHGLVDVEVKHVRLPASAGLLPSRGPRCRGGGLLAVGPGSLMAGSGRAPSCILLSGR